MLCPTCQRRVPEEAAFCPSCGHKMGPANEAPVPPSPAPRPDCGRDSAAGRSFNLAEAAKWGFSRYFEFDGRASGRQFWMWVLFTVAVGIPLAVLSQDRAFDNVFSVWSLAALFPMLAAIVRRLHDSGRSGWDFAWCLTGIGAFYVIYLLLRPTGTAANRYGPPVDNPNPQPESIP